MKKGGHDEIVRILLTKGADVHHENNKALRISSQKGYPNIVQILIQHGAVVNQYVIEIAHPDVQFLFTIYIQMVTHPCTCGVCHTIVTTHVHARCKHHICPNCIDQMVTCPLCRIPYQLDFT